MAETLYSLCDSCIQVYSGMLLGKLLGRYAGVSPEYLAEIAGGAEAALFADLIDRKIRVFQQHLPGTAYTDGGQMVHDGFAGLFPETGAQVFGGLSGMLRQLPEGNVFRVVLFQIEKDIRNQLIFLYLF